MSKIFPLGYAKGTAFCNRTKERTTVIRNIELGRHSVIFSRRLLGKSSLVHKAIFDITNKKPNIFAAHTELLSADSKEKAEAMILEMIGDTAVKMMNNDEKAVNSIAKFFASLNPVITIKLGLVQLKLSPGREENVKSALLSLDMLAETKGYNVALFFDEFHKLGEITNGVSLEAEIRGAGQEVTSSSYIFSGSIRHLLEKQFSYESRPLFRLCHRIELGRMSKEHFEEHLNKISTLHWHTNLKKEVTDLILELTDCHPYYVNALCGLLWVEDNPPTLDEVNNAWQNEIIDADMCDYRSSIRKFEKVELRVLYELAKQPTNTPFKSSFVQQCGATDVQMIALIDYLEKHDHIYRDDEDYLHILDPAIKAYLKKLKVLREEIPA